MKGDNGYIMTFHFIIFMCVWVSQKLIQCLLFAKEPQRSTQHRRCIQFEAQQRDGRNAFAQEL